ncbi:MAG: hypothetical protein P0S94_03505, partial [Simkaniaceae bacterium]|nr:hypothetical protein [Simkaniaceae bacterium]
GGGMNLISFKRGEIEAIDQNTRHLYEERFAGLGALIGPHFYQRAHESIATDFDHSLFPHIARAGREEPFSHGIARYAPWKYEASETQITARLSGKHEWNGVPLKTLQGFDFEMTFTAKLVHDGLLIDYAVKSEKPSVIGFHYYYRVEGESFVDAMVKNEYRDVEKWLPMPDRWWNKDNHKLHFPLNEEADWGFMPYQSPNEPFNRILLRTKSHLLHIDYCGNYDDQTSWQLYHPQNDTFACIEPLTALNPRKPSYNETKLQLKLSIY